MEIHKRFFGILCQEMRITFTQCRIYENVLRLYDMMSNGSMEDPVTLTGDDFKVVEHALYPYNWWTHLTLEEPNCVFPRILFEFLQDGGSIKDAESYRCVKRTGFLHGKPVRLKIV